jgi:hypothetical protein
MEFTIHVSDQFYKGDPHCKDYLEALQELVQRMDFSFPKYGVMGKKYPHDAHAIDSGRQRLWMYDGIGDPVDGKRGNTGNTENCLDAANQLIIERIFPSHPKAHFKAQERTESPGLVFKDGLEKFNYTPQEGDFSLGQPPSSAGRDPVESQPE